MRPSMIRKSGPGEIEGSCYAATWNNIGRDVHFVARFDRDIDSFQIWSDQEFVPGDEKTWPKPSTKEEKAQYPFSGAKVSFTVDAGAKLNVKIGLSYTNVEGARRNLEAECAGRDFDAVREEAREDWNHYLRAVTVKGGTESQRVKFYTDQFRTAIGRHAIEDVDGAYSCRGEIKRLPLDAQGPPSIRLRTPTLFGGCNGI